MKPDLSEVADAVLEGKDLDWQALESSADPQDRRVILQFRTIAEIAGIRKRVSQEPGESWGHLSIEDRLGTGAFGAVYKAWDSRLQRRVALKLLRSDCDPAGVLREARLLARVHHPNIVTVFDAAEFDGRAGFWMEFVEGRTLEQAVQDHGPFDAAEVLRLALGLGGALAAVHAADLLHRDIKTHNVIQTSGGRVVLMDFGAGDERAPADPESRQGAGTPLYLAPEVLSGSSATPQSDIYSLGVLLFRVATGKYPVSGATIDELRNAHAAGMRRRLADAAGDFPRDLARIIDRAMEPDPSARFATAADMVSALALVGAKSASRRAVAVATAAMIVVTLAVAAWPRRDAPAPASASAPAVAESLPAEASPREVPPALPDLQAPGQAGTVPSSPPRVSLRGLVGDGIQDPLAEVPQPSLAPGEMMRRIFSGDGGPNRYGSVSPDGKWLSSTVGGVFVHELATGVMRALVVSAEGSYALEGGSVISPDSRHVAYVWVAKPGQHEIRIVAIDGSLAPQTVYSTGSLAQIKAWSPDGRNLLIAALGESGGQMQMLMVSIQDRSDVRRLLTQSPPNFRASISPDGRYLAYDSPQAGIARDIFILPTAGGEPTQAVRHSANDHAPLWSPDGERLLFLSDRTAPPSLWSVSVKDGKPEGEATLIKSDLGTIAPLTVTATGKLYYSRATNPRNVFKAVLDENGKISGTPAILTETFVNSSWGPAVSFDGKRVAYYSDRPNTVLVVRNLSDGLERVYPLSVRILPNGLEGPKWLAGREGVLVNGTDSGSFLQLHEVELDDGLVRPISSVTGVEVDVWPDGKSVLLAQAVGGPPRLGRLDLSTRKLTPLELPLALTASPETAPTALQSPRVSRDGNRIAFVPSSRGEGRGRNDIIVSNAAGAEGGSVYRYPAATDRSNTLAWSYDDRYILFVRNAEQGEAAIWRVPADGGEAERIGPAMKGFIRGPQMHPDGRSLFFTALGPGASEVWVLENFLPTAQNVNAAR